MVGTVATTYGGYEYQIVVSVWLALDLILARAWCEAIESNLASDEDVAVDRECGVEVALEAFTTNGANRGFAPSGRSGARLAIPDERQAAMPR